MKPRCRRCHSRRIIKAGFKPSSNGKSQRYQCTVCGHVWIAKQKIKEEILVEQNEKQTIF